MGGGGNKRNDALFEEWEVLATTFAYTVICISIGFTFRCRRKKWMKSKDEIGNIKYAQEPNNPREELLWVDTNPYICNVEEVVQISFFDEDVMDNDSLDSDDSDYIDDGSKKNEYWENKIVFDTTDEQKRSKSPYELYGDEFSSNVETNQINIDKNTCGNREEGRKSVTPSNKKRRNKEIGSEKRRFWRLNKILRKGRKKKTKPSGENTIHGKRDYETEGLVDTSGEGSDTFEKEMQEIRNLSIPWTFSSFISYFASIVAIALIANFMNVASMIAYSYVWFIIDAAFIYSSALYNSLYKHVNNAIASKTEEGYTKAGKYIRVCIIINLIISIPISIGVVLAMDPIMEFYGFHDVKVQGYAIIAVIHNFFSYTSSFVTISSDIDGYADFNAKYAFLDSLVDILISAFVIPLYKPTLVQLGLIHLANEILSTSVYYFLTWSRWGWYDRYKAGLGTSLTYDRKDKKALSTLIKKSIPMTLDELNGELEWLVSAYLASFIGQSASSAWVLLSYIWGLIDVVPSCIGSAVEYRVAYQLSKGNIELSKQISSRSMELTCITSLIGTACFFFARHPLINFITHDDEISQQLFSVMPYIVLCQPLISLSTNGAYLNRALAMYRRSTKVELLITCLITLPLAGAATFVFGLGIEGLLAASFMGYATTGAVILAIYNNADWEKAVRKNMKIAGTLVTSKVASFGKEVV